MKAASATGASEGAGVSDSEPIHTSPSIAEPLPQSPDPMQTNPARAGSDAPTSNISSSAPAPISPEAGPCALWSGVIDLASSSVRMQALLRKGKPVSLENNTLTVEVEGASRSMLERQTSEIETLLRKVAQKKITLVVRAVEMASAEPETTKPQIDLVDLAQQQPLVQHAIKVFHGRVESAFVRTSKSPKP